jgi:hypothetical protein
MYDIQQSTTAYPLLFFLTDSTDHITGKTGLSPTVTIRKVGGSFASPAGAVTEIASGWYQVAGNATDSNTLGPLLLHATGTGADPTDTLYQVVAYNPQVNFSTNVAAGASGGLQINGSNAGTTTYAALTVTGSLTVSDGLLVSRSSSNAPAISAAGNGTGAGILATGGATGIGLSAVGGATSGSAIKATGTAGNAIALELVGQGSAQGLKSTGGATGNGVSFIGGATSGHGLQCTVTSGNEIDSDITGAITGNITGNLSGSVGSVTARVTANTDQFNGTSAVTSTAGIPNVNLVAWKNVAPADLVSTRVDTTVGAMQSGVITATATAADCIDASALATDAVTEIVTAILAAVVESEDSITLKQALSVILAGVMGETASGTFKSPNGVATRADVTYTGNDRTNVTLTPA